MVLNSYSDTDEQYGATILQPENFDTDFNNAVAKSTVRCSRDWTNKRQHNSRKAIKVSR